MSNKTILDEIKELSVVYETIGNNLHNKIEEYLFFVLGQCPDSKMILSFDESEELHHYNECNNQLSRLISIEIDYYNSPFVRITFQTENNDKEITSKMLESFDLKYQTKLIKIVSTHFENLNNKN